MLYPVVGVLFFTYFAVLCCIIELKSNSKNEVKLFIAFGLLNYFIVMLIEHLT